MFVILKAFRWQANQVANGKVPGSHEEYNDLNV